MSLPLDISPILLDRLEHSPQTQVTGKIGPAAFTAGIAIPDYEDKINAHFSGNGDRNVRKLAEFFHIPFSFTHFGLIVRFETPTEILVHDEEMRLDDSLRALVARFGPVIVRNAHSTLQERVQPQKNIFQNLRFHYDRGRNMENQHSFYTRNPFDPAQSKPRTTSTLFLANIVAHMQCMKEEGCKSPDEKGLRPNYDIFQAYPMADAIGSIILEQPWTEPEGIGEFAVIDNVTVLHASWHHSGGVKSYPIGTRYLF